MMQQPRKLDYLNCYSLQASDGEIGQLKQVYFDDQRWTVRYFIVHTGNWLLGQDVLIVPSVITAVDDENKYIKVNLTQEQIKNCPEVTEKLTVSRHYEQEYYRYYGWKPYWVDDPIFGPATSISPPVKEKNLKDPEHPHLHSSSEVKSYRIHTHDGDIGQVKDFILEEPDWTIRYLEIDTNNWLPGKHVLIAPSWIQQIDWAKQMVIVDLARDMIEKAPPYDPSYVISQEYQLSLYKHYGMKIEGEEKRAE